MDAAAETVVAAPRAPDAIAPIAPSQIGGLLGKRLGLWRQQRLWRVGQDPFLLDGFESPPGRHPWQGEHVGKWLHAATLAYDATRDERLAALIRQTVARLLAAQGSDGYLGTYAPEGRFHVPDHPGAPWSWDVWTHRYLIYGLLACDRAFDDPAAVDACARMGDLLERTFGPPSGDVTRIGTRHGLSSAVLLESVVMLYERTGDERQLRFAEHIAGCIERNPRLRLSAAMRAGADVTVCGDGKAYQLMAVLLGYCELYRHTGRRDLLETVVTAWERIRADHLTVTGGPWGYPAAPAQNHECFAPPGFFQPSNCVETCSTTTWIQLCLRLFCLTGQARYADEAERAALNHLLGAQAPDGMGWAYHTMLNAPSRGYQDAITCCASSGPRALELYARHLSAQSRDSLIVASYLPQRVAFAPPAPQRGTGVPPVNLIIEGHYPFSNSATLRIEPAAPIELAVDFRLPVGASAMRVFIDGSDQPLAPTAAGFHRLKREWRPGEAITVQFDFPLTAHFATAWDGARYVAFSRGPLALAQDVRTQLDQPNQALDAPDETADATRWVEPVQPRDAAAAPARDGSDETLDSLAGPASSGRNASARLPAWRLKTHRKLALVPYCLAGATGGGVRTMFPVRPAP